MTDDTLVTTFLQALALVGATMVLLIAFRYLRQTPEYRSYLRLQEAKGTWAKLLTQESGHVRERTVESPSQGTGRVAD